jgi:hypothetical protein
VYATLHEPDGCQGLSSSSTLRITMDMLDKNGAVAIELGTNSVGNFASDLIPPDPYTINLINAATGATVSMVTPQTSGDCNGCHTENGTTIVPGDVPAAGRIIMP